MKDRDFPKGTQAIRAEYISKLEAALSDKQYAEAEIEIYTKLIEMLDK